MKDKTKMKIYFYIEKYAPVLFALLMCMFTKINTPVIGVVINIATSITILLYLKEQKQIPAFEVKEFNDRLKRYSNCIIINCVVSIMASILILLLPYAIFNIFYPISVALYWLLVGNFIRHLIILYQLKQ